MRKTYEVKDQWCAKNPFESFKQSMLNEAGEGEKTSSSCQFPFSCQFSHVVSSSIESACVSIFYIAYIYGA